LNYKQKYVIIFLIMDGFMKNDLHVRTNFSASASKDCSWEKVLKKCQDEKIDRL